MPSMASDSLYFTATCPVCKEPRDVIANRRQVRETLELVEVFSIKCEHTWKLTDEQGTKLRSASEEGLVGLK